MTHPTWWPRFAERIELLKILIPEAIADGEREVGISTASLRNATAFARRLVEVEQPGTFVQHDGTIRLVWQDGGVPGVRHFTEQVAIRFMENGRVDFVLFRLEGEDMGTSHIMGTSHADAVLGIVDALGLHHVLQRRRKPGA